MASGSEKNKNANKCIGKLLKNRGVSREIIDEEMKISLVAEIDEFVKTTALEKEFSVNLDKEHRKYIHKHIMKMGLNSKSHGVGDNRRITIYKPQMGATVMRAATIDSCLSEESYNAALAYLQLAENLDEITNSKFLYNAPRKESIPAKSKPKIVPPRYNGETYMKARQSLPIFAHKNDIMTAIADNQVVIINGETGSGKTTQVPQYLLEQATDTRASYKIVCTQPRRIAAITLAERVAQERGENIGHTVGYQIRLEGKVSERTCLIYTTSGCLLRTHVEVDPNPKKRTFDNLTHIIIDEIHERDKNTDFLLITLKDKLSVNRSLRVILMSATMNIQLLRSYFGDCPIINVPGRMYETSILYLEDVLYQTSFYTQKMKRILREMEDTAMQKGFQESLGKGNDNMDILDEQTKELWDETLHLCFSNQEDQREDAFAQLIYFIIDEELPVNLGHSVSQKTPLIAATESNNFEYVQKFLKLGADKYRKDDSNKTAMDYAQLATDRRILAYLNAYKHNASGALTQKSKTELLLQSYHRQLNDDNEIDHNLLLHVIKYLHDLEEPGSILVFLPGFTDIIGQKDRIEQDLQLKNYRLYMLHSNMKSEDQRRVMRPTNERKIILSTNISETSITIPDVVYVIDAGKVKQNTYDSVTGSSHLLSCWISKSCAKQRAGRAGRTQNGVCYRLFSKKKYDSLPEYDLPEMLRTGLTEICLYAKIIGGNISIASYLSKALEPPTEMSMISAVEKLTVIGALDEEENLTLLGKCLADIPLDVQFGKALLFAVMFECLDPILTIVAFLSVKDPFILPSAAQERARASFKRKQFCENSFSDHLGIVNAFNQWYEAKQKGREYVFCEEFFLSRPAMDMILGIRRQLIEYLIRVRIHDGTKASFHLLNQNSDDWNLIKGCLTAGLYPNICFVNSRTKKIATYIEKSMVPHPSSVIKPPNGLTLTQRLEELPTRWILFNEKIRTGVFCQIKGNTVVTPTTISLFCGTYPIISKGSEINEENKDEIHKILAIDTWIKFNLYTNECNMLLDLRDIISDVFYRLLRGLTSPRQISKHWQPPYYNSFLRLLKKVMQNEEFRAFGNDSIISQETNSLRATRNNSYSRSDNSVYRNFNNYRSKRQFTRSSEQHRRMDSKTERARHEEFMANFSTVRY